MNRKHRGSSEVRHPVLLAHSLSAAPTRKHANSTTEHVREYTRNADTVVYEHDRAKQETVKTEAPEPARVKIYCESCEQNGKGRIARSAAVRRYRREFEHSNPCPATGLTRGPCPGY